MGRITCVVTKKEEGKNKELSNINSTYEGFLRLMNSYPETERISDYVYVKKGPTSTFTYTFHP